VATQLLRAGRGGRRPDIRARDGGIASERSVLSMASESSLAILENQIAHLLDLKFCFRKPKIAEITRISHLLELL
jgi:hypothetical protein